VLVPTPTPVHQTRADLLDHTITRSTVCARWAAGQYQIHRGSRDMVGRYAEVNIEEPHELRPSGVAPTSSV
jgi:hypothetical protein